jgi:hypothetical protein
MTLLVDKLCLNLIFYFKKTVPKEIIYLDPASRIQLFLFSVLGVFGIKVRELHFHFGDIDKSSDDNLYHKSVQLADILSRDLSKQIIENTYLDKINREFGRNTLQLRLAKCYMTELIPFCQRVVLMQEHPEASQQRYIQKPYFLSWAYVKNCDQLKGIHFYSKPLAGFRVLLGTFIQYIKVILRHFYVCLRSFMVTIDLPVSKSTNIILSLKEDSISTSQSRRNQQFWIQDATADYTYFVLDGSWGFRKFSSITTLGKTHSLPLGVVGLALRKYRKDPRLVSVSRSQFKIFLSGMLSLNMASMFAFLNVKVLFLKSVEMGALALLLNANKYVFKETHGIESDAMQLVSGEIGVNTYAIQYSNLVLKNCWMISTADKFLIFSEMYKRTFSDEEFSPLEFVITGYPYREVIKHVKQPAEKIRSSLHSKGATMIIGYFDETIVPGKFSLTNKEHHHYEVSKLAELVISNKEIAVIIKTQFIKNNIASQYSLDQTIQGALNTGRLIDLCHGSDIRNTAYPTEVALASDICVGNMVGGTASLEVALSGNRSAVINPYNFEASWKHLLSGQNIVFPDLDHFLLAMQDIHKIDINSTSLGDWSSIINEFDPHHNEFSFERIQREILQYPV